MERVVREVTQFPTLKLIDTDLDSVDEDEFFESIDTQQIEIELRS